LKYSFPTVILLFLFLLPLVSTTNPSDLLVLPAPTRQSRKKKRLKTYLNPIPRFLYLANGKRGKKVGEKEKRNKKTEK
jgi:hypothetical protein